ncbi:MAG TPA: aspartate--ammonia ligase [Sedimentisphaerales bacterium]|nr:aspartate--ammonia ligase [Sedimentisphaerales bacterium]
MPRLYTNKTYKSHLSLRETEAAIKFIKDFFEHQLAQQLCLQRISAPLFVRKNSGINDDLNGIERKATFAIKDDNEAAAEMVFSLAKWKRMALADYGFQPGEGLYTDMNAVRPDEECLDNLHSIYVDQWDWEQVITAEQRKLDYLKDVVRKIYLVLKQTEAAVQKKYPAITPMLPEQITFVHTEDLVQMYPDLTPAERENKITAEHKAVFLIGIGASLPDGRPHDGRAPDYDDWITDTGGGKRGLNGDILLWYPLLDRSFEISSMGIRVDRDSLLKQLKIRDALERVNYQWHKKLLDGRLPLSIGGGIGQSRLCMFFLRKLHIGEVQASIWPDEMLENCARAGIKLL